jgi:hypothetical protein
MSDNPEEPIFTEMPHVTSTLVGAASATLALACVGILTTFATLDTGKLDRNLQISAVMFAIALPMLFMAAVFALWLRIGAMAYLFLVLGVIVWGFGLYNMLIHISGPSSWAFLFSLGVCSFVLSVGLTRHQKASKMKANRRAEQHHQSARK